MQTSNFTSDWFSHHIPFWTKLAKAANWSEAHPLTMLEIGSYEGRSTIWACQNILTHPDSRITCVDTFDGSVEHSTRQKDQIFNRFRQNISSSGYDHKVVVRRGTSALQLPSLIAEGFEYDFCYIDGSHQAPDVIEDAVLCYRLTKAGGLIVFDDYHWQLEPHGQEDLLNSPKLAVDCFINLYRRKVRHFGQSAYQIALQKTS